MIYFLAFQPENNDPIDFTFWDAWDEFTTDAEIVSSWTKTLSAYMPDLPALPNDLYLAARAIAELGPFAVMLGHESIEIYLRSTLPADTEYEQTAH
jgi:hypothetical protein